MQLSHHVSILRRLGSSIRPFRHLGSDVEGGSIHKGTTVLSHVEEAPLIVALTDTVARIMEQGVDTRFRRGGAPSSIEDGDD